MLSESELVAITCTEAVNDAHHNRENVHHGGRSEEHLVKEGLASDLFPIEQNPYRDSVQDCKRPEN